MKVYLAGSFAYKDKEKTKTHQRQLEWAAHLLKEKGLDVYLPQELHIHNMGAHGLYTRRYRNRQS